MRGVVGRMRRLTALLFGLFTAAWLAGCSDVTQTTTPNDPDSQAFINQVIPAVFGHWSVDALVTVADKVVYTPQRVSTARERFRVLAKNLGPMTGFSDVKGTTQVLRTRDGETKHASYSSNVSFSKGSAVITLDADKSANKWLVENISIQPAKPITNLH